MSDGIFEHFPHTINSETIFTPNGHLPVPYPLGSGVPCPCCGVGLLWASRDGSGEVDSYLCGYCRTWAYCTDEQDPNNGTSYEPGDACDIDGMAFWMFDPTSAEVVR